MRSPMHVTAGNHAAAKAQRGLEHYPTPACAVEALLRVEPLPSVVWEPCDPGSSDITAVITASERHVVSTDITVDGVDFLQRHEAPLGAEAIVTNPPFSLAADFVRRGLTLVPKVIVLERIQFLESETRSDLFDAELLARVWVFRKRVPRMHHSDWTGKRAAPAMCLAWFAFDRDYDGSAPTLGWISC